MAMAVGEAKEGEPMSEINTTPLIDVMLVLLIMLIVTIPPQRHAVKLDSPRPPPPNTPPPQNPIEPIRIIVDFDGTIYWNGTVVDRAAMEQDMIRAAAEDPQPEIHIEPHKLAKYAVVAEVMASAQRLGLEKLGVIGGTQ
ncbi:MAG: biopolymer transporter ExbD [Alphaproteobacteria bacterium]|nr:biopolymer transporter ExbD [Alphaproteobacteria bacterium]